MTAPLKRTAPCRNGHSSPRNKHGQCAECRRAEREKWWADRGVTTTRMPANMRNERDAWLAAEAAAREKWWIAHLEAALAAVAKQRAVQRAASAARRARKRNQSPALMPAERKALVKIYADARRLTEALGELIHVDHVIPLARGGLHHPSNLQLLTAVENARKGARLQ